MSAGVISGCASPLGAAAAAAVVVQSIKSGPLARPDTQLATLYYQNSPQAAAVSAFTATVQQSSASISADGKYVLVDATAKDGDGAALLAQMQAFGTEGGSSYGAVASGWVPTASLGQLAATANLAAAAESLFTTNSGSVDTQADHAEAADTARTTYNVTGAGLRVGILSDSFNLTSPGGDTMAADITSGDLPTDTVVVKEGASVGEDEGRRMAQLVHDLAPGASIDFATAGGGQAAFANNIAASAAAGDKIIVDDYTYFAEPSYQNGVIAQEVNKVESQGVTYFSSAANNGAQGYAGAWKAGGAFSYGGENYTLMNFAPGQDYISIKNIDGCYFTLQWDSPAASAGGAGATNDLDLFLVGSNGTVYLTSVTNNIGGDPFEAIGVSGRGSTTYRLYVGLASGAAPTDIRITAIGNVRPVILGDAGSDTSNTNDGTLFGHNGAAGAISVGAASFADTPANGVNPPVSEYYSSRGVDRIFFDDAGNRLATPTVNTPAITGVDGGNTTFFGSDSTEGADSLPNFYGTSAAAPDAAAVAALMLEANSTLTPTDIRYLLEDSAIVMADPTTNGTGLIQADRAVGFAETLTISNSDQATLYGTHLNDTITASNAGNTLIGGAGADTLIGGTGNDTASYRTAAAGVTASLNAPSANTGDAAGDTYSSIENLTGSAYNDKLTGSADVNILNGGAGDDTLIAISDGDTLIGGAGSDVLEGDTNTTASYATATAGVTVDLSGNTPDTGDAAGDLLILIQNLTGSAYNDTLTGDGNANILTGGLGDDTYYIQNSSDKVIEAKDEGNDTVYSSVSYNLLAQYIETLTLTGTADINATGNGKANVVNGNSGANVINGAGGDDVLTGKGGDDIFRFNTALGANDIDTITDFTVGDDMIQLDRTIFSAIGKGTLTANAFEIGTDATSASTRIVYDAGTGDLFYDADGNGAGQKVEFATLSANLGLTNSSFIDTAHDRRAAWHRLSDNFAR